MSVLRAAHCGAVCIAARGATRTRLHYCKFGTEYQKPTYFWTNIEPMIASLREGNGANPRSEILVRHAEWNGSEDETGPCLDDRKIDLPLRTGFGGRLPCICEPHAPSAGHEVVSVNCDGTGRASSTNNASSRGVR